MEYPQSVIDQLDWARAELTRTPAVSRHRDAFALGFAAGILSDLVHGVSVQPGYAAKAYALYLVTLEMDRDLVPAAMPARLVEPAPIEDPALCTHGADCEVHPDVNGLHNFDARDGAQ